MKLNLLLVCLVICASGCHHDKEIAPVGGGGAVGGGSPSAAGQVSFRCTDGWIIFADFSPAPGSTRAIILLHMRNGSAADWKPIVPALNKAKYTTLALDSRGVGRSTGKANGENAPWDTTPDITAARAFLASKGYGSRSVSIIGASYGANNALIASAKGPSASNLVLLSPGEDYHGLKIAQSANKNRARTLVIAAKGDPSVGRALEIMKAEGATVDPVLGEEHGTDLIKSHIDVIDRIVAFLK